MYGKSVSYIVTATLQQKEIFSDVFSLFHNTLETFYKWQYNFVNLQLS